ncbi:MAG TPA: S9 family peptidase [Blastocatellia bacterium]|nr:S9 family peptidase [Blastocatellia bacterium]
MGTAFKTMLTTLLLLMLWAESPAQEKLLTIDDIYDPEARINFSGSPPPGIRWLKDGVHYLQRKEDPESRNVQMIKVNAATGRAAPLYDAAKMETAILKLPGVSTQDAARLSQRPHRMNPAETAVVINYANDLFYYQLGSESAVRLTSSAEEEMLEDFSPDGKMVSFVSGNNLWVVDVAETRARALTSDGSPKILNGRLDWVYQEEVFGRGDSRAYWWSPDSSQIAYMRLDETEVNEFTVVDHIPYLQKVEVTPYPKSGDPNPKARLGIVAAAGGPTKWVDLYKYQNIDFLITRVAWAPDSKRVAYQVQDREQTWLDLDFAAANNAQSETAFTEKTKTWVDVDSNPYWLKDGSFLWFSERSGWKHLYYYSGDGKLIRQITDGKWEARQLHGVDEATGWLYFNGTEHSHIASHLYRIKLDGSGLKRLTEREGNHQITFSPLFTHYVDSASDVNTPTQIRLYTADGKLVRVIDENRAEALKQYKLGVPQFLQVPTRDGFMMEAMMIKPPDFDPSKKYPVWSYTYGGPHAPQVRNSWGGATYMWHQMLAQKGYIIWICDNRTASGKGAESAWPLYRNFGELELRDLEDGVAWLKKQPYVDGSRIGLWGWSFGGFMTCYALTHSTSFKIGIAGGSVTDWRDYDSIYTERYMGTPQNNPAGYKKAAPVAAAKDLHGKLLLLHGMIDDNVHVQNTVQFAYELQKAGKQFQLMVYPKSRHGVVDPALLKHMRSVMTEFILANL